MKPKPIRPIRPFRLAFVGALRIALGMGTICVLAGVVPAQRDSKDRGQFSQDCSSTKKLPATSFSQATLAQNSCAAFPGQIRVHYVHLYHDSPIIRYDLDIGGRHIVQQEENTPTSIPPVASNSPTGQQWSYESAVPVDATFWRGKLVSMRGQNDGREMITKQHPFCTLYDAQNNVPRGLLGTLILCSVFFGVFYAMAKDAKAKGLTEFDDIPRQKAK